MQKNHKPLTRKNDILKWITTRLFTILLSCIISFVNNNDRPFRSKFGIYKKIVDSVSEHVTVKYSE